MRARGRPLSDESSVTSLRDNLGLEGSVGLFIGEGVDLVGRFGDSDFAYLRVKYYF